MSKFRLGEQLAWLLSLALQSLRGVWNMLEIILEGLNTSFDIMLSVLFSRNIYRSSHANQLAPAHPATKLNELNS